MRDSLVTLRKWLVRTVATVGACSLLAGAGLIVKGEIDRMRDDARFRAAQAALKSGIGVFDGLSDEIARSKSDESVASGQPAGQSSADLGGRAIARLRVEKIGLDVAALAFTEEEDLELGLTWMPDSAPLGAPGTSVVVGHRTLFGAPLKEVDQLVAGDEIEVIGTDGTRSSYFVRSKHIRRPQESFADLITSADTRRLLLVTCHPEHSTEFRLLVVADAGGQG